MVGLGITVGMTILALPELGQEFDGLHVHDSIVVIDKAPVRRPTHSRVQK